MIGGPARGGTAPTRLAGIARDLLVRTLTIDEQLPGGQRPYPFVPDTADFASALRLQTEWEIINGQIEALEKPLTLDSLRTRKKEIEMEMNRP